MNIKELQIGDYFRVAKDNLCISKGTVVEIRGIDADNSFEEKNLKGCASCRPLDKYQFNGGIWVEHLEPIPLTAELLEKNGFRKITLDNVDKGTTDYYIDPDIVGNYNMDKRERVHASQIVYIIGQKWLFVDDKTECRIEMWCPYVHTFQHALRLCGIEKNIEP